MNVRAFPERGAAVAALLLGVCATAGAQALPALPDPGALQRSQQQQQEFLNSPPQAPQAVPPVLRDEQAQPGAQPGPASAARFVLKKIEFTPSHYLSEAQLQAVAGRHVGQEVRYDDLQKVIGEINALYREQQILTARAILPPQRVADGVVRIELVEGKLGQSSIEGNETTRASWIDGWLGAQPGEPLDTSTLERKLELYNHVNSTQLNARLRPGEAFGATDLVIQAQEPPRYQMQVFADNMGSPSTGRNELGASGAINNLLGIGDQLGVYLMHSEGADSGALNYSLPVNQSGGRLGASFSSLSSHVVSGPYRDFDVDGRSRNARLQFSQPVLHRGAWWLDGTLGFGQTRASNEILGAELGDYSVRSASVGLQATGLYDTRSFSVGLIFSNNLMSSDQEDDRRANLWNFSGSWTEKITDADYSVVRVGGQQSSSDVLLNGSLAMQLGGAGTVRGYDPGAVSGDSGYYANLEWHHRLFDRVTGYAFADVGGVHTQDTPSQRIGSFGLGVDVTLTKAAQLSVVAARASNIVFEDQGRWQVTARVSWQVF